MLRSVWSKLQGCVYSWSGMDAWPNPFSQDVFIKPSKVSINVENLQKYLFRQIICSNMKCLGCAEVTYRGNDFQPSTGIVVNNVRKPMVRIRNINDLSTHNRYGDQIQFQGPDYAVYIKYTAEQIHGNLRRLLWCAWNPILIHCMLRANPLQPSAWARTQNAGKCRTTEWKAVTHSHIYNAILRKLTPMKCTWPFATSSWLSISMASNPL